MEAFDDDIDKDYIIKLLSEAYAARLSKNVYDIKNIPLLLEEDLMDAIENSNKRPVGFDISLECIAKNITGSSIIEEKAEIHKISKSIFDEELDKESQRYFQKSLEDWKSRITENIEKQYEDRYKKWQNEYLGIAEEDDYDKKAAMLRFIDKEVDKQNGKEPEQHKIW